MSSDIHKFYFRLVLLGSNGTGKTSILNRFLFAKFEPKHKPTVEDLFTKTYDLGSIEIKVDILDTSGSMQFPAMRRLSITNGDAFLLVYSVDDENSFEVLKMCVSEIQEIRRLDYQEIPIVFVGNKSELPREMKRVPKELVSNYVYYELPRLRTKVIECSCKENVNIETIFRAYLSLARVTVPSSPTLKQGQVAAGETGSRAGSGKKFRGRLTSGHTNSNNGTPTKSTSTTPSAISRASSGSGKRRPNSAASGDNQQEPSGRTKSGIGAAQAADGSFKVALAVRKSCDASIITSMRQVSLGGSRDELASMRETQVDGARGQADEEGDQDEAADQNLPATMQKSSIESLLKANQAAQNQSQNQSQFGRLNVSHGEAKPRSRSLIWRPSRKSSKTSSGNQTECRVS